MFESFKRCWMHFVFGFCAGIGLSLLLNALLNMFHPSSETPLIVAPVTPPRFVSAAQGNGLYVVTDIKTGKKYLWTNRGSLIEVPD